MNRELVIQALQIAQSQIGVRETKPNSGPQVDQYLKAVGLNPGYAWCQAFIYWSFQQAAGKLQIANPTVKTAGVMAHWNQCEQRGAKRISAAYAQKTPTLLTPGQLFVLAFGKGLGHIGFVETVNAAKGTITTIEGNTNDGGSREGIAVLRRTRTIASIGKGFIDYGN